MPRLPTSPRLNTAGPYAAQTGAGVGPVSRQAVGWSEGVVLNTSPADTYRIKLTTSPGILDNVPRLRASASDVECLAVGTGVLVYTGLPMGPYIMGILPKRQDRYQMPTTLGSAGTPNILPGDRRVESPSGNFVAALNGGMNVVKSTGDAQLITYDTGQVDLLSGTFRHISKFGESVVSSDGVTVNYSIRGGSSIKAHTGIAAKDSWPLRIDAGAKGDLLKVCVTDVYGEERSRIQMRPNGAIEMVANGGRDVFLRTGDTRIVIGPERSKIEGSSLLEVAGTRTEELGSRKVEVRQAQETAIGGNNIVSVGGVQRTIIGKQETHQVREAGIYDVLGSYQLSVANPAYGAIPLGQTMSWINYGGGYNFVLQQPTAAGGTFNILSPLPASVNLAVDGTAVFNPLTGEHVVAPVPGPFGAVLYEPLAAFLTTLMTWLDTHVHGTAVGPTTPPPVPSSATAGPQLPAARSIRVSLGA